MTDGMREPYSPPPRRRRRRRRRSYRPLLLLLAMALIVGGMVGGTLAWLLADTQAVVNTFTESNISIKLEEETGTEYTMVPGFTIPKDPKVSVTSDSEDCYLFVEITENKGTLTDFPADVSPTSNFKDYLNYEVANGWNPVDGSSNVYYREVKKTDSPREFQILADDQITVSVNVTMEMMAAIDGEGENGKNEIRPSLTFQAYAVQLYKSNNEKFDVGEAWTHASSLKSQ